MLFWMTFLPNFERYPYQILQYIPRDPWDWYIYLLIYNKNEPIVGKYTSPMDGMGYIPRDPNTSPCQSEDDGLGCPFITETKRKVLDGSIRNHSQFRSASIPRKNLPLDIQTPPEKAYLKHTIQATNLSFGIFFSCL